MKSLWRDVLLSLRSLRKEPLSAIIASLTLALGIGLCSTTFSLVYGVFLRGLDVPAPDRLTLISRTRPADGANQLWVTVHDFYDWREQQTSFEGLGHVSTGTVNLSGTEGPERFNGAFVSASLFDVLRVRPAMGSGFRPGDDAPGAPLTVVLGHATWETRYSSDPGIVGKAVVVNGEAAVILGVMPEAFQFPSNQELWVARRDNRGQVDRGDGQMFRVVGRLKDGVSMDQAELEMSLIAGRLAQQYPATNKDITTRFRSFVEADTGRELVAVFGAMQVATVFVLLIAIANVSNLLLARATMRTREAAVRSALGASRMRVVLPFFAETLVLSVLGAALGTVIALVGVRLFDGATQGVGKPYYMVFALDWPVVLFVVGTALVTALIAGLAPALHILRTDVQTTLKDESRGSSGVLGGRVTRILVTAEIALSCALLIGAGLMVKSIVKLRSFEFPFATENVLTARVGLFETEYPDTAARQRFFRDLEDRLAQMPGAASVALTTSLPANTGSSDINLEGETYQSPTDYPSVLNASVSPGFFETFGVKVLAGRGFDGHDDLAAERVAIVNQSFVRRFFGDQDALGRRFAERVGRDSLGEWRTIVGIVPDMRMEGFDTDRPHPSAYFIPLAQRDIRFASLVVRTAGVDPLSLVPAVREMVRGLNPNQPIYNVDSMAGVLRQASWFYRVFGTLFIVFGAAALFMATVGLYGVLSFSVSRRMKEMGIRMALGANAKDVIRLVVRQGGKQLAIGLALGIVLAFGLTRVISILMFETTPQDPPVFILVVVLIAVVGLLASLVPARRATRAHPMVVLRFE